MFHHCFTLKKPCKENSGQEQIGIRRLLTNYLIVLQLFLLLQKRSLQFLDKKVPAFPLLQSALLTPVLQGFQYKLISSVPSFFSRAAYQQTLKQRSWWAPEKLRQFSVVSQPSVFQSAFPSVHKTIFIDQSTRWTSTLICSSSSFLLFLSSYGCCTKSGQPALL